LIPRGKIIRSRLLSKTKLNGISSLELQSFRLKPSGDTWKTAPETRSDCLSAVRLELTSLLLTSTWLAETTIETSLSDFVLATGVEPTATGTDFEG